MFSLSRNAIKEWSLIQHPYDVDELNVIIKGSWAICKVLCCWLLGRSVYIRQRPWHVVRVRLGPRWGARIELHGFK